MFVAAAVGMWFSLDRMFHSLADFEEELIDVDFAHYREFASLADDYTHLESALYLFVIDIPGMSEEQVFLAGQSLIDTHDKIWIEFTTGSLPILSSFPPEERQHLLALQGEMENDTRIFRDVLVELTRIASIEPRLAKNLLPRIRESGHAIAETAHSLSHAMLSATSHKWETRSDSLTSRFHTTLNIAGAIFLTITLAAFLMYHFVWKNLSAIGTQLKAIAEDKPLEDDAIRFRDKEFQAISDISRLLSDKQQELIAARNAAEIANDAKSRFLSSMSHELRTPLNAVIGFGQLLEMKYNTVIDKDGQSCLNHILKNGQHLLQLIEKVLDLAKIEEGVVDLNLEWVDAGAVINETASLLQPQISSSNLSVTVEKQTGSTKFVMADELRLRQILMNLLSNAIKYNQEGGSINVLSEHMVDGRLKISVTDTGVGIPAEKRHEVFSEFTRLGHEGSTIEGSGVGLAICKKLVELMDGEIDFVSTVGKGSTFWVILPLAQ